MPRTVDEETGREAPGAGQNMTGKHQNIASKTMQQAGIFRQCLTELQKLVEEHKQAGSITNEELQVPGSETEHLTAFLVESFLDNVIGSPNGLTAWYTDPAHPERKDYLLQILP